MPYHGRYSMEIATLFLVFVLFWYSCEHADLKNRACDNCISTKPSTERFIVHFTHDENHQAIPFRIFNGTYESGAVVVTDTATSDEFQTILNVGTTYTVAAEYMNDGKTITVINTGTARARRQGCTDGGGEITHYCWYVIPGEADARLKE